jgi:hypothetical protein
MNASAGRSPRVLLLVVALVVLAGLLVAGFRLASEDSDVVGEGRQGSGHESGRGKKFERLLREEPSRGASADGWQDAAFPERPTVFEDDSAYGSVEGVVLSTATDLPIEGAELLFMSGETAHLSYTNAEGRFRFVAPDEVAIELSSLTAEGYIPYAPQMGHSGVSFRPRAGKRIAGGVFRLSPASDYEGMVVDAEERPVAGAEIALLGAGSGEQSLVGVDDLYRSDEQGRFTFHAPAGALLEASHPDHPSGRARVDENAQATHRLRIKLGTGGTSSGATIRGVVVGPDDAPRSDVRIRGNPEAPPAALFARVETVTDDRGRFELEGIDDVSYTVTARSRDEERAAARRVRPGAKKLRLRLESGLALRGRVVGAGNQEPVPQATVVVSRRRGLRVLPVASSTVLDPEGRFEVRGLAPGSYDVTASAPGRAQSAPVTGVVSEDEQSELVLELAEGGRIYGVVVDARSGEALAGARVQIDASGIGSTSVFPSKVFAITDASGNFELRGVAAGRHSMSVASFQHHASVESGIEVLEGQRTGPIQVELRAIEEGEKAGFELVGIGASLRPQGESLTILEVFEGSGAEHAGLQPGERLLAVEGTSIAELGFEQAVQQIRGREGTLVDLEVLAAGESAERRTVRVRRQRIVAPPASP